MEADSVIGPCEWCLTFSGRTKKGRVCCELRALASMPKAQREQVYLRVRKEDGVDACDKLKRDVGGEYRRRLAYEVRETAEQSRRLAKSNNTGNLFA